MTVRPTSVIICTYNRAALLPRIIGQVRAQSYPADAFEIIVVDHRSTDDTPQVVKCLASEPGPAVRYVTERTPGVSCARNRGAAEAHNPVLAYIDDDCTVGPDWLAQLLSGFDLDDCVVGVSGQIQLQWDPQKPSWFDASLERWFAVNRYLGGQPRLLDPGEHIVEGNMALERRAWQTCGGFLGMEQFGSRNMAAGEILYMLEQFKRRGSRVAFVPQALALHHVAPRTRCWMIQRSYWQGVSDALLHYLLKHPSRSRNLAQISINVCAIGVLLALAAGSVVRLDQSQGIFNFARAVRRFGLLCGQMHLAGDWSRVRAWLSENDINTGQKLSTSLNAENPNAEN